MASKSKKLLFVWYNLDRAGGEVALYNLIQQLKHHYKIGIICFEEINKFTFSEEITLYFIAKATKNKIRKCINKLIFFYKLFTISSDYDLLIVNEIPFLTILSSIVNYFNDKRLILWEHVSRNEIDSPKKFIIKLVYHYVIKKCHHFIFVSYYAKNSLQLYINRQNLGKVIYNLVEIPPINYNCLSPANIHHKFCLCAVGRLSKEKNFLLLIDAMYELIFELGLDLHLNICGDGDQKNLLEETLSNLNLSNHISLIGFTNHPEYYIANCDLFISTSNSESFSMVVYEALYYQKPVITTNTGALEIIGDNEYGLVIEKGNLQQLVKAIDKLYHDKTLRDYYSSKAKEGLTKFNTTNITKDWISYIENC